MQTIISDLITDLSSIIYGKKKQIKLSLTCLFSGGHLLIEDLPGMGKTTLSHALSIVLGLSYQRVQFTSDLLPSDILGANIFNAQDHSFSFFKGPIFSQVLLADEINRAGPKTQSALLEAMEEKQVTIDGHNHPLPTPFFVIATQNPINQSGTYPLPESQLDRFFMCISLGFPSVEAEKKLIMVDNKHDYDKLSFRINSVTLQEIQNKVNEVTLSEPVIDYILKLVTYTRNNDQFINSLSPRASIALSKAAKAWAFIDGRGYVTPEDVQAVFLSVTIHRLGLDIKNAAAQIEKTLCDVDVPA